MIRLLIALAACAACATAQAQPAPRVTLDVNLPAAEGFIVSHDSPGARLAIGNDGTHYILLHQFIATSGTMELAPAARVDLLALAPDGGVKQRRTLPVREKISSYGFAISSLGIAIASSGELAVFWSPNDHDMPPTAARRSFATLLRLGADGSVKKASPIGPPSLARGRNDPGGYYEIDVYLPTPDNALLLGGGFGSGPYAWWMGKFSLDGVRIWQAGPGNGFPERVAAIGRRPDGRWVSLVTEMTGRGGLDWFVRHNAADGKLLARRRVAVPLEHAAAVLRDGGVLVAGTDDAVRKSELVFVDDSGSIRRRAQWPFPQTIRMIADGDGVAAIVDEPTGVAAQRYIVRADAQGTIRWRSAAADVAEIVRTPEGHIAALVRTGKDGERLRLVRYTDP